MRSFIPVSGLLASLVSLQSAQGAALDHRANSSPTSIPQVVSAVSQILAASPTGSALASAFSAIGVTPIPLPGTAATGVDSTANVNPLNPSQPIYPKKSSSDAPYSLPESTLRGAIYIPSNFQYGSGSAVPIICVPGTGVLGSTYYYYTNFAKYLKATGSVDPVWLNIPDYLLDDAQVNAEYVAYAANYISAISSGKTVAILSWSQGGIDAQWAFKYWPSTRSSVQDHIAISPDYHGTILEPLLNALITVPASLAQQSTTSHFITTLLSNTGDSAYVPTTTIYSGTDEIVQPQQGSLASAFLLDNTRSVGVTNNYLQSVCLGQPAGSFVTHEGVGYNPVTFSLIVDAVTHAGPGQTSRLNLASLCPLYAASVFSLADVLQFEANIVYAVETIGEYSGVRYTTGTEPAIMSYAA